VIENFKNFVTSQAILVTAKLEKDFLN